MKILGARAAAIGSLPVGSPKRLARDVRELLITPVREHSRKPDELYAEVERYAAGPYLELNARTKRPGWDSWGNEAGKFVTVPPDPAGDVFAEPDQGMLFGERQ